MMDVRPALVLFTALFLACGAAVPAAQLPAPKVLGTSEASADLIAGQDQRIEALEASIMPAPASRRRGPRPA